MNSPTLGRGFSISIGDVDEQELRWWSAILANGCGWRATLTRSGREYSPPWACHLNDDRLLTVQHNGPEFTSACPLAPPSSAQAQCYLVRLAQLHNAADQLIAAFAAVLTIPRHQRFGARVELPEPHPGTGPTRDTPTSHMSGIPSSDELPYFMSLSCVPRAISPSLFGSFWEPGVPCNLASEWLYTPLQEILQPLVDQERWQVIVQIMATRRPNLAPLWLGSAITGLLPRILKVCASCIPPVSLEATVWTLSPQSFMDPIFHRKPTVRRNLSLEKVIPREDEFRLLYITNVDSDNYATVPLCPYRPFGVAKLQETALEVRLHVSCGHRIAYSHWVWCGQQGGGSQYFDDYGVTLPPSISPVQQSQRLPLSLSWNAKILLQQIGQKLSRSLAQCYTGHYQVMDMSPDEELSERATRNLFSMGIF